MIMDLWIRCKFPVKHAKEYYADMQVFKDFSIGDQSLQFTVRETIFPEALISASESYQKSSLKNKA
jgi:hypothetical protein